LPAVGVSESRGKRMVEPFTGKSRTIARKGKGETRHSATPIIGKTNSPSLENPGGGEGKERDWSGKRGGTYDLGSEKVKRGIDLSVSLTRGKRTIGGG